MLLIPVATVTEPAPPDPDCPRYGSTPLPRYRYVPGRAPHPSKNAAAHAHDPPDAGTGPLDPARFCENAAYLHAIDLYNLAYWWECHEVLEVFWRRTDRASHEGRALQGVIMIAAANLKRFMGAEPVAQSLAAEGVAKLDGVQSPTFGIDVDALRTDTLAYFAGARDRPATIRLLCTHGAKPAR